MDDTSKPVNGYTYESLIKADALNYYSFKSLLHKYLVERSVALENAKTNSEYDYCEVVGRIKELTDLTTFLDNNLK